MTHEASSSSRTGSEAAAAQIRPSPAGPVEYASVEPTLTGNDQVQQSPAFGDFSASRLSPFAPKGVVNPGDGSRIGGFDALANPSGAAHLAPPSVQTGEQAAAFADPPSATLAAMEERGDAASLRFAPREPWEGRVVEKPDTVVTVLDPRIRVGEINAWLAHSAESAFSVDTTPVVPQATVSDGRSVNVPVLGEITRETAHLVRIGDLDEASDVARTGWDLVDLVVYSQDGGRIEPDRPYATHPLSKPLGEDRVVTVVCDGSLQVNNFVAFLGALGLADQQRTGPVVVLDSDGGRSSMRFGGEAHGRNLSLHVAEAYPDLMLAGLKPDQYIRYLAETVHAIVTRGLEHPSTTVQTYNTLITDIYRALQLGTKRPGHPPMGELIAATLAIKKEGAESQLVNAPILEYTGPLTPLQYIMLNEEYPKPRADHLRGPLTDIETILRTMYRGNPREWPPKATNDSAAVEIITVPDNGTFHAEDIMDFVLTRYAGQVGDSGIFNLPRAVIIPRADRYTPAQLRDTRRLLTSRNVGVDFLAGPEVTREQLLAMRGIYLIARLPQTAVAQVSEAFGTRQDWTTLTRTTGTNTAETTGSSRSESITWTKTKGSQKDGDSGREDKNKSRGRNVGITVSTDHSKTSGSHTDKSAGWHEARVVSARTLLNMEKQAVLLVGRNPFDPSQKNKLFDLSDASFERQALPRGAQRAQELRESRGRPNA